MIPARRSWFRNLVVRLLKFGSVGVANTIVGLGAILVAMLVFNLSPVLSNIIGYVCGLSVSFVLNSRFTFSDRNRRNGIALIKFLIAFAIAYGLNISVLVLLLASGMDAVVIAQIIAMGVYTCSFFLLSQFFVFRHIAK